MNLRRKPSEAYMLDILTLIDESMDELSDEEFFLAEDCISNLLELRDTVKMKTPKCEDCLMQEIREICIRMIPFMAIHLPPVPSF
jgi:hypothetical protein